MSSMRTLRRRGSTSKPKSSDGTREKESKSSSKKSKEDDGPELFCICQQPYDSRRFMIGCDHCDGWFHARCVNITVSEAERLVHFICPPCKAKRKRKENKADRKKKKTSLPRNVGGPGIPFRGVPSRKPSQRIISKRIEGRRVPETPYEPPNFDSSGSEDRAVDGEGSLKREAREGRDARDGDESDFGIEIVKDIPKTIDVHTYAISHEDLGSKLKLDGLMAEERDKILLAHLTQRAFEVECELHKSQSREQIRKAGIAFARRETVKRKADISLKDLESTKEQEANNESADGLIRGINKVRQLREVCEHNIKCPTCLAYIPIENFAEHLEECAMLTILRLHDSNPNISGKKKRRIESVEICGCPLVDPADEYQTLEEKTKTSDKQKTDSAPTEKVVKAKKNDVPKDVPKDVPAKEEIKVKSDVKEDSEVKESEKETGKQGEKIKEEIQNEEKETPATNDDQNKNKENKDKEKDMDVETETDQAKTKGEEKLDQKDDMQEKEQTKQVPEEKESKEKEPGQTKEPDQTKEPKEKELDQTKESNKPTEPKDKGQEKETTQPMETKKKEKEEDQEKNQEKSEQNQKKEKTKEQSNEMDVEEENQPKAKSKEKDIKKEKPLQKSVAEERKKTAPTRVKKKIESSELKCSSAGKNGVGKRAVKASKLHTPLELYRKSAEARRKSISSIAKSTLDLVKRVSSKHRSNSGKITLTPTVTKGAVHANFKGYCMKLRCECKEHKGWEAVWKSEISKQEQFHQLRLNLIRNEIDAFEKARSERRKEIQNAKRKESSDIASRAHNQSQRRLSSSRGSIGMRMELS
eukprot:CAMPEP_0114515404 /NCGR_PEP_ID=MMETSP0109-20121206/16720_1 /TAXON_ID=29199 /ORGANISM="Chlorarachnion reptans, Strain CCCM449" /LENGTH=812 /DNA_ID=CAMNT_0001695611 /DNA_START=39 /DNA_END=2477 /DNA_ORIENTATION=-